MSEVMTQISETAPRPGYKMTEVGVIPEDWEVAGVGDKDVCEIIGGGTPSTKVPEYWGGGIPWATPTDITALKKNYIEKTAQSITEKGLKKSGAKLLPVGSILMTSRATIGYCAINTIPMATNQGFASLFCGPRLFNQFILYAMLSKRPVLESLVNASTFGEISKKSIRSLKIALPPLPEQRRISAILSNVDENIQKTQQIIEKTEELKRGLMQQLLTRGIGHTRFKQTEIGEIPEEWEIKKLGDICKSIVPGRNRPKRFDGDIPWITLPDIDGIFINNSKSGLMVSEEEVKRSGGKVVPPKSVIMSCVGELGVTAIARRRIVINQQLHAFVCPDDLDPYFLALLLNFHKNQMLSLANTTVVPYMNKENCESVLIPVVPFDEQRKIVSILSSVSDRIAREHQHQTNLDQLKKGLMQVLLSGKVRVKTS